MRKINERLKKQKGQTTAEYALVVVMVVAVVAAVLGGNSNSLKTALNSAFSKIASTINAPPTT